LTEQKGARVLPADIAQQTTTPARAQDGRALAFDLLLALLHRNQFREFAESVGTRPKLYVPETIWDKYLWRKIFDHDPQFTVFCDKLAAKHYAASRCPDLPAAKVLWQADDIGQAPAELLKGPGFLKSNHASGLFLKLDEKPRSLDELQAITDRWLRGWHHTKPRRWKFRGQWGYKNVQRTLFIEEDLGRETGKPIVDFAVYVFGGKITHMSVMLDHKTGHQKYARFDGSGRRSQTELSSDKFSALPRNYRPPVSLAKVCDVAGRIAGDSDHLRIDLIWNGQDLYFSEITVYSQGGFVRHLDQALMAEMTEAWDLRRSWFLTHPQSGWRRLYADWLRRTLDASDPHTPA